MVERLPLDVVGFLKSSTAMSHQLQSPRLRATTVSLELAGLVDDSTIQEMEYNSVTLRLMRWVQSPWPASRIEKSFLFPSSPRGKTWPAVSISGSAFLTHPSTSTRIAGHVVDLQEGKRRNARLVHMDIIPHSLSGLQGQEL